MLLDLSLGKSLGTQGKLGFDEEALLGFIRGGNNLSQLKSKDWQTSGHEKTTV